MTARLFVWTSFIFMLPFFGPCCVLSHHHKAQEPVGFRVREIEHQSSNDNQTLTPTDPSTTSSPSEPRLSHGSTPANMICPSHSIIEIFVHSMDIDCAHEFVEVVDGRGGLLYRSSSADCKSDANTLEPLHSTTSTATFTFNRNSSHTPSYKLTWSCKSCGLFAFDKIIPSDVMSPVTDLYCISLDLSNPSNSITFADFGSKIVIPGLVNSTNRPVEWTLLSYFLEDDSVEETNFGPLCIVTNSTFPFPSADAPGSFYVTSGKITTTASYNQYTCYDTFTTNTSLSSASLPFTITPESSSSKADKHLLRDNAVVAIAVGVSSFLCVGGGIALAWVCRLRCRSATFDNSSPHAIATPSGSRVCATDPEIVTYL
eukprot:c13179_g4_i5.p1 GENE.c13179_g4_i5~~c13179_g4_i5.p1  ORF type:complete len:372 (-),score=96.91 c13179_g4_i5:413-1528(-)